VSRVWRERPLKLMNCGSVDDSPPLAAASERPNPALQPLAFLIGDWRTTGTHPDVEGAVHGRTTFEWHLGGAFLLMRSEIEDDDRFPSGLMLLGSAYKDQPLHAIYFDEREVGRHMTVEAGPARLTWQRDDPDFAQRLTIEALPDGTLKSTGDMRKPGGAWQADLSQRFRRA
jgi:hypothetical protein